ncbi:MAG TPA: asparaginase [Gemmatimonadaceae bacterium]|jgi:L-asparaginase II|nr:asparaginase [Gemmatimonadaceae bacterium]
MRFDLDVIATRGDIVESRHRVHAAVVDARGVLRAAAGDPDFFTVWRSCAKPFQAMALVESGQFDELAWGDDELALSCASHGGEPEHLALAQRMLDRLGLEQGDLVCGPHDPITRRGAKILAQSGEAATRLHNNCSGKHAAMLALARTSGWPTMGYESSRHPVQHAALEHVAHWTRVDAPRIGQTVDGCGVVAFGLPLRAMAGAFARLGDAARRGDEVPARIVHAMVTRPFLVGGTDRFDTVLMEETEGRVLAKVGAEGIHTVAVPDAGFAFTVKVEDGASRAQYPAVLRLLQLLDVLPDPLAAPLASFLRTPIINTRGVTVGEVRPMA